MNAAFVSIKIILGAKAFGPVTIQGLANEGLAVPETVLADLCKLEYFDHVVNRSTYFSSDLVFNQVSHEEQ